MGQVKKSKVKEKICLSVFVFIIKKHKKCVAPHYHLKGNRRQTVIVGDIYKSQLFTSRKTNTFSFSPLVWAPLNPSTCRKTTKDDSPTMRAEFLARQTSYENIPK